MKRFGIVIGDFFVTHQAGAQIIRRSDHEVLMGDGLIDHFGVSFVAGNASHLEMRIFLEQLPINNISFVHFFRPDRGRHSSSALSLARRQGDRFVHRFHHRFVGMAGDTAICGCAKTRVAEKQRNKNYQKTEELFLVFHKTSES